MEAIYNVPHYRLPQSVLEFRLELLVKNKLKEIDIIKIEDFFVSNKTVSPPHPKHKTKLIKVMCTQQNSRFVEIEHGYVIFAVLYILNLCDEKQKEDLLKNDEISKLYRGMENAK